MSCRALAAGRAKGALIFYNPDRFQSVAAEFAMLSKMELAEEVIPADFHTYSSVEECHEAHSLAYNTDEFSAVKFFCFLVKSQECFFKKKQ